MQLHQAFGVVVQSTITTPMFIAVSRRSLRWAKAYADEWNRRQNVGRAEVVYCMDGRAKRKTEHKTEHTPTYSRINHGLESIRQFPTNNDVFKN